MDTLFGWMIIIGFIAIVVGIIMLIVKAIKKKPKKSALITLIVGVVLLGASVVYVSVNPSADYEVTTTAEGKDFNKKLIKGEDLEDKTVEVKISKVGDADPTGNYIGFSGVGGVNLAIESNAKVKAIKAGDIVTVKVIKVQSLLGMNFLYSELDD